MASKGKEIRLSMGHEGGPAVSWRASGWDAEDQLGLGGWPETLTSADEVRSLMEAAEGLGAGVNTPAAVAAWLAGEARRAEGLAAEAAFRIQDLTGPLAKRIKALGATRRKLVVALAARERALLVAGRGDDAPALVVEAALLAHHTRPLSRITLITPPGRAALWRRAMGSLAAGDASLFHLMDPSEVYPHRKAFADAAGQLVVVDEAHRLSSGGRLLDGLRGAEGARIIAVTAVAPEEDPAAAYGYITLLAPDLSGPRRAWWLGRYARGAEGDLDAELKARFAALRVDAPRAGGDITLRIPLAGSQAAQVERAEAHLSELLAAGADASKVSEAFAAVQALSDSTGLRGASRAHSAKLDELVALLAAEVVGRGQKAVVFTLFEAMTKEIADALTAASIGHGRFYRKLPRKRREALAERFNTDPSCAVLVVSDVDRLEDELRADLAVHFDVPWAPSRLGTRAAHAGAAEAVTLVAAGTLEERILDDAEAPEIDGADPRAGAPIAAHLGPDGEDRLRLARLLGVEIGAAAEEPAAGEGDEARAEAEPAGASPAAPTPSAPAGSEPGDASPEEPAPEAPVEAAPPEAPAAEAPVDAAPPEAPAPGDAEQDPPRGGPEAPRPPEGPLLTFLDSVEVPLKAVNRLIAGLPWVGQPLSAAAGILWQQLNAAAGRR